MCRSIAWNNQLCIASRSAYRALRIPCSPYTVLFLMSTRLRANGRSQVYTVFSVLSVLSVLIHLCCDSGVKFSIRQRAAPCLIWTRAVLCANRLSVCSIRQESLSVFCIFDFSVCPSQTSSLHFLPQQLYAVVHAANDDQVFEHGIFAVLISFLCEWHHLVIGRLEMRDAVLYFRHFSVKSVDGKRFQRS